MDMKALRQRSGHTAEAIAQKLGLSVSTVQKWDQGQYAPRGTADELMRVMEVYQCSLLELAIAAKEVKG